MSNFPAYLEHEVKYCPKCGHRWLGSKACPHCSGKKTGNVHYEHYKVDLRAYNQHYRQYPERGTLQGD